MPRWLHVTFFGSLAALVLLVTLTLLRERDRPVTVAQRMVPALGVVDRCEHCHEADAHPGALLDTHPVERFGCTPCHGGQGLAVTAEDAHEAAPDWEHPLFEAGERESACGGCHLDERVAGAPLLSRGRTLLRERGCAGCHGIPGLPTPDIAPALDGIREKTSAGWVRAWLTDPAARNADHRMPRFQLTDDERDALVAFLWSLPATGTPPPPSGDAERGRVAVATRRCATCHRIDGRGGGHAPDLGETALKLRPAWLYALLLDERRCGPPMPRFRIPPEEAADIVALAMEQWIPDSGEAAWAGLEREPDPAGVERGRQLFTTLGCAGCHAAGDVPRTRSAMALDTLGARHLADLPVVTQPIAEATPKGVPTQDGGQVSAPAPDGGSLPAPSALATLPPTIADWIATKILTPTAFDVPGGAPSRMPAYEGVSPEDARAMGVALASLGRRSVPGEYRVQAAPQRLPGGRVGELVERFRCLSCHRIDGSGGDISRIPLDGEGARVRGDWLRAFLVSPVTLRMNQPERMPVLGMTTEEADLLAAWIESSLDDPRVGDTPTGDASRGRATYDTSGCATCHVLQGVGTMEGPTLDEAGARLNPAWVAAMLTRPELVPEGRHTVALGPREAADLAAWIDSLRPVP